MTKKRSKVAEYTEGQDNAIKARVATITAESALKAVADLAEQTRVQLQRLEDIKRARTLEEAELEVLHGKDVLLRSTDEMQAAYDLKQLELQTADRAMQREFQDRAASVLRQQEAEAAQYRLDNTKTKLMQTAQLETEIHNARTAERTRREDVERGFAAREEVLQKAEAEVTDLRTQVAKHPADLNAAEGKGKGMAEAGIKRELEHKLAMVQKDAETAKQLFDLQVNTLRLQNAEQQLQIVELNKRLDTANKDILATANKALDSASGARTLQEIQTYATNGSKENGTKRTA